VKEGEMTEALAKVKQDGFALRNAPVLLRTREERAGCGVCAALLRDFRPLDMGIPPITFWRR
jgi:hypothetical protein